MQSLTPSQALERIRHYCAYQERCHAEVRRKLYGFGLNTTEVAEITSTLISENFLNEERFALSFARGKFRMKGWGKQKIISALKSKEISDYCIRKAINQIEDADYLQTFKRLADKKRDSLKSEKNIFIKKRKVRDYLMRRGFSSDLIYKYLGRMDGSNR